MMGRYEEVLRSSADPSERLLLHMEAQTALLSDIRQELRYMKIVLLKQHIELTHVCDSTRSIEEPANSPWTDTVRLQLTDDETNDLVMGIQREQSALDAAAKNGQVAIGG
jgi:hypothetical protein